MRRAAGVAGGCGDAVVERYGTVDTLRWDLAPAAGHAWPWITGDGDLFGR